MKNHPFDLQLFAGEEGGAGTPPAGGGAPAGGSQAGGNAPAGADPAGGTQAGGAPAGGTILGGTGGQENQGAGQQGAPAAGVPEAYDFTGIVPEGMEYDEPSAQAFASVARECGLSQEQAAKVAAYGMQYMQNGVNAAMQQIAATHAQWAEDAKAQLGADFDKTVAKAAVGIDRLSQKIPGLRQMFNETGAGNRLDMIKLMAEIGELVGEDRGHGVPGYGGEKTLYPNTDFKQYR